MAKPILLVTRKLPEIMVTNTPGVLSFAVAECALMLMLMDNLDAVLVKHTAPPDRVV